MFEKDKLNLLSVLDAVNKISEYCKDFHSADEFYTSQRDFDAAMMNFIIIGEMVVRLSEEFIEKYSYQICRLPSIGGFFRAQRWIRHKMLWLKLL